MSAIDCTCWSGLGRLARVLLLAGVGSVLGAPGEPLVFHGRQRVAVATNAEQHRVAERTLRWEPHRTAAVVCDMWDRHWCRGATERVAEMAPRVDRFLRALRERGVLIIHCPSDTLTFYAGTPQRALAAGAAPAQRKVALQGWRGRDPQREPELPIDDRDGGCDDVPRCAEGQPWRRQIESIRIEDGDAVSDSAEVLNLMAARGIEHVLVMGVHLNMCVLGRPFGIRQLVGQGLEVALVRDLTDTMYNSRQRPQVSHFCGTDLMVEHVETYWCPSVTSAEVLGGLPFRFSTDRRPRVVVLAGEDEYETWDTLPRFVASDLVPRGVAATVLHELESERGRFPGLEGELASADAVLVSIRRRALPQGQLEVLQRHVEGGRGLVGIRTASHAFTLRSGRPVAGWAEWTAFDAEVLGGNYQGHYGESEAVTVQLAAGAAGHPVLDGVNVALLRGCGSLYRTSPLKADARLLLWGAITGKAPEPLAWVRLHGGRQARVAYTSLGHPQDFAQPEVRRLLANAVMWAAGR